MRTALLAAALVLTAGFAQAQGTGDGSQAAQAIKADCDQCIIGSDNGKTTYDSVDQHAASDRCMSYFAGVMNESSGELFWNDTEHTKLDVGSWQNVNPDQMIRSFVKYLNANPENLNKSAQFIILMSAMEAKLYILRPEKMGNAKNAKGKS